MKVTYRGDIDIRLRVVDGCGWSIPIRCRACETDEAEGLHWHVTPAVHMGAAQADALSEGLRQFVSATLSSGWLLSDARLELASRQAEGVTPEFYFKWDAKSVKAAASSAEAFSPRKTRSANATAFLNQVAAATGMPASTVTMAWLAITQHAPGWLLSGKDLDLGFVRLTALPYRANWKEIILARHPSIRKVLMVPGARRLAALAFTAAARVIRMCELTESRSFKARPLVSWTIEASRDSSWEKHCRDIENETAARLGPIAYMRRWASLIASRETRIYELLAEKVAMDNAPACRVLWKRGQRGACFGQGAPIVLSTRPMLDCDDGGGQSVDDFLGVEDGAEAVEAAVARMLEVSDAGQEEVVVRAPRGDGEAGGDSGVLVPPSDGGDASEKGVLDGEHGAAKGVGE